MNDFIALFASIAICVIAITVGVTTYNINRIAFENGYEASTVPNIAGRWIKAKHLPIKNDKISDGLVTVVTNLHFRGN